MIPLSSARQQALLLLDNLTIIQTLQKIVEDTKAKRVLNEPGSTDPSFLEKLAKIIASAEDK